MLAVPFAHYGNELRLVAAASRRLVEKLVALDTPADEVPGASGACATGPCATGPRGDGCAAPRSDGPRSDGWTAGGLPDPALQRALDLSLGRSLDSYGGRGVSQPKGIGPEPGLAGGRRWDSIFAEPIANLAAELLANRNLLAALAGPGLVVTVDTEGGARPVRLTAEDLTRLMVNLVKNAAEAMPGGGRIQISLRERPGANGVVEWLDLVIEDNGPGITPGALEKVFEPGFTTHPRGAAVNGGWPAAHRGLGLAISRSVVEASGGHIAAANRTGPSLTGARFEIELPVRGS